MQSNHAFVLSWKLGLSGAALASSIWAALPWGGGRTAAAVGEAWHGRWRRPVRTAAISLAPLLQVLLRGEPHVLVLW